MSILSSNSSNKINKFIFDFQRPQTCLQLIQKVGDGGRYQKILLHIFCLNWFVSGTLLLILPLLLQHQEYDCIQRGVLIEGK